VPPATRSSASGRPIALRPVPGLKALTSTPVSLRSTNARPAPEVPLVGATTSTSLPAVAPSSAIARPSVVWPSGSVKVQSAVSAGAANVVPTALETVVYVFWLAPWKVLVSCAEWYVVPPNASATVTFTVAWTPELTVPMVHVTVEPAMTPPFAADTRLTPKGAVYVTTTLFAFAVLVFL